jgi:hypothetical protein
LSDVSAIPDADAISELRARVVSDLEAIANGEELRPATIERLQRHAAGITIHLHELRPKDREMILAYKAATIEALTSYLTWQIYQARPDARQFPGDIYRCQLCKRFFFASDRIEAQGGRPPTKFCSRDCMLERHAQTAAARAARYRHHKASAAKHK